MTEPPEQPSLFFPLKSWKMNADSHSSLHTTAIIFFFFFQQRSAAFLLYKSPPNSHHLCVPCSKCCPRQGSRPSPRQSTSSSLKDVQWKVGRESCACTGHLSSQLEYLFVIECPPSSWLPCSGVFLYFYFFFFFSKRFLLFTQLSSWASPRHKAAGPA